MPYIKLPPKKKWINKNHNDRKKNKTDKQKLRTKLYNLAQWKKVRQAYIMEHPLCERCLANGVVNGNNIQIHHKKSPFDEGLTEGERLERLLSWDNLETICAHCHGLEHYHQQQHNAK